MPGDEDDELQRIPGGSYDVDEDSAEHLLDEDAVEEPREPPAKD